MAFNDVEIQQIKSAVAAFVERKRPPPHIRAELDLGFRIQGQSVELFEIRPVWRGPPGEMMERPFAKATYIGTRKVWNVYWQRADLKWHAYSPAPTVGTIETFLALVNEDKHCCFFG